MEWIIYFLVGMFFSYIATLPPGAINLNVGETAIRKGVKGAWPVAYGAAFVEFFQTVAAVFLGDLILKHLSDNIYTRGFSILFFLALGSYFFFKKVEENPQLKPAEQKVATEFGKGMVLALFNPQALPFWVVSFSFFQAKGWIDLKNYPAMGFFIVGASVGKVYSLMLYAYLGKKITDRMEMIKRFINKIIGTVLISLAIIQILVLIFNKKLF
ncbi:MAG: LysE family transporter [Saprospiraceae bacterium]|nr:LysE family transporter [Saprospiraceae bacterium]